MNTIKQDIGKYLSLRRSLGYKLRGYDRILGQFADFLQQRNASYITRNLALAWLQQCDRFSATLRMNCFRHTQRKFSACSRFRTNDSSENKSDF